MEPALNKKVSIKFEVVEAYAIANKVTVMI